MELNGICPICGRNSNNGCNCKIDEISKGDWKDCGAKEIYCALSFHFVIHPTILYGEKIDVLKRFHMIYHFLFNKKFTSDANFIKYNFYYGDIGNLYDDEQKIDVAGLMKNYPETFSDKMDSAILGISQKFSTYGDYFRSGNNHMKNLLYCNDLKIESCRKEIIGTLAILVELGYLISNTIENLREMEYKISADGWRRIAELDKKKSINQGFIAMSFRNETMFISDSFKKVIMECGYAPRRIDEKEHNNQIVPEILFEISQSKFIVVDITFPNYGAYYEAGYAEALGKEVIICCRDTEFNGENKPHFDIAQKSTVVWKDIDDLEKRLKKRIQATVGLNE